MAKKDIIYLYIKKEGLMSVSWIYIVSAPESVITYIRKYFVISMFICILLILYLSNASNKKVITQEKINFLHESWEAR